MKRRGGKAEAEHRSHCSAEIPAAQTRADRGLGRHFQNAHRSLLGLRYLRGERRAGSEVLPSE